MVHLVGSFVSRDSLKKQPPNHVVVVHWVSNALTVFAQAPVPHAGRIEKRVLFVDHWPGRDPLVEAIGIARSIARTNKWPDAILV